MGKVGLLALMVWTWASWPGFVTKGMVALVLVSGTDSGVFSWSLGQGLKPQWVPSYSNPRITRLVSYDYSGGISLNASDRSIPCFFRYCLCAR